MGAEGSGKDRRVRAHEQRDLSRYFLMRRSVDDGGEGRFGESDGVSRRRL